MTHEQTLEILETDLRNPSADPTGIRKLAKEGRNLTLRIRSLPGGKFCWVLVELKPETKNQISWQIEIALDRLPTAVERFRESKIFDHIFQSKVRATVEHLEQIRSALGVSMTVVEAMG